MYHYVYISHHHIYADYGMEQQIDLPWFQSIFLFVVAWLETAASNPVRLNFYISNIYKVN